MSAKIVRVPLHCPLQDELRGAVAIIGNFDGVHLGHQELIRRAVTGAGDHPVAVIAFSPHPRQVLQPDAPPFLLTPLDVKADLLGELGVRWLFVLPFTDELRTQTPEVFVDRTLSDIMGIHGLLVGSDFRFGSDRAGDAADLSRLARQAGMTTEIVSPVLVDGEEKYSSSLVREALRDGRVDDAADMLGRPWTIRGEVVTGRKLARTLGFPTANIDLADYLRPKFGVYAVSVRLGEDQWDGIANIGNRPTVDGLAEMLEVHLFDADRDLYGRALDVSLLHFLRDERRFDGIDALQAQIRADLDQARAWHSGRS